jgi:hypothetical protein
MASQSDTQARSIKGGFDGRVRMKNCAFLYLFGWLLLRCQKTAKEAFRCGEGSIKGHQQQDLVHDIVLFLILASKKERKWAWACDTSGRTVPSF